MKICCSCGTDIVDQTDYLPHKAHFIPDQDWLDVLDAIDAAVEKSGPSPKEKEAACMAVRRLLCERARSAWQCRECGRVYIDDPQYTLRELVPGASDVPTELFRSRTTEG